jgi:Vitamin B6 photo-protection and homoeostasis
MISRVVALVGLLLCIVDMIPKLDAFHHSCSAPLKCQLSGTKNSRLLTTMSAFPLEDAVLIEHSNLGIKKAMRWDDSTNSFQQYALSESVKQTPLLNFFKNCFVPSGAISSDYYTYSLWRSAQRFVSATSSVFGTQALLLALGFKSNRIGIAAATTWVLKDALGKVSRIFWASKHGRKFDSDAKKWRFRSSILFATGNGLEIFTYIVPSMFLVSRIGDTHST